MHQWIKETREPNMCMGFETGKSIWITANLKAGEIHSKLYNSYHVFIVATNTSPGSRASHISATSKYIYQKTQNRYLGKNSNSFDRCISVIQDYRRGTYNRRHVIGLNLNRIWLNFIHIYLIFGTDCCQFFTSLNYIWFVSVSDYRIALQPVFI